DDVCAEDLTVLLVANDLDEALGLTGRPCAAVCTPREAADLVVEPLLLRPLLGQADGRNLRMTVRQVGEGVGVDPAVPLPGDVLHQHDAFVRRLVCEQRRPCAVTDRIHALRSRLEAVIHLDEAAIRLHTGLLQPDVVDDGRTPHGDEHAIDLDRLVLAGLVLERELHALLADIRLLDARRRVDRHAALLVAALDDLCAVLVLQREHLVQRLDDRHLRAERGEHVSELHPDRAGTDDRDALRRLGREYGLITAPHAIAINLQHGERARPRAGREHDVLRAVRRLLAVLLDLDLAVAGKAAPALDRRDLVLLEQERDALVPLRGDALRALRRNRDIQRHIADVHAEVLQRRCLLCVLRALQHRLGRDAADVVAHTAQLVRLDTGDLEPELRAPDGRDIAARPRADHNDIKGVIRHVSPSGPQSDGQAGKVAGKGGGHNGARGFRATQGPATRPGLRLSASVGLATGVWNAPAYRDTRRVNVSFIWVKLYRSITSALAAPPSASRRAGSAIRRDSSSATPSESPSR